MPIAAMNINELTLNESMRICLLYFEQAVCSASKNPVEAFVDYGQATTSVWDLREDLIAGKPLLGWNQIPKEKRKLIEMIVNGAERLPQKDREEAFARALIREPWGEIRNLARLYVEKFLSC